MLAVDPTLDPAFRLPHAAVERWAREVFLSAAADPERPPPADVLSGMELYKVHRILIGATAAGIARGPGRALLDGLRAPA